ncbi:terminase small subunit [Sporosarcina sp. P2]
MVESDNLTDKQRPFCIYYIKSFNATNTAYVGGSRLLRNAKKC